jgi:hypothetical protein
MNPPPLPPAPPPRPSLGAAPRKSGLFARVMIVVGILFVAFMVFRVVQFAVHMKDHPVKREAGMEELSEAARLIVGSSRGIVHGNNSEARKCAEELSRKMQIIRQTMFEGGNPNSIEMKVLTKGEFLVFCQLNEDSCAFLIHVPEMRRYTDSAKESIAELAYVAAAGILDSAEQRGVHQLAVATRGSILYETLLIGDYSFESKNPLSHTQKISPKGVLAPPLYPFFAPKPGESTSAKSLRAD